MYSRITIFLLLIAVIFLGRSTYHIYSKEKLSAENYATVQSSLDDLKKRENMLDAEIKRLNTERGVEEEIRSKFSVAKPGETVVLVINSTNTASTLNKANSSLWAKFKSLFQ